MEYVVPCSTQSQFPYLWSALLQSAHWMPVHGDPGVHEMGMTRAVLARELSYEQIKYISQNAPIETEVFVHGALCFCHSGQCYM